MTFNNLDKIVLGSSLTTMGFGGLLNFGGLYYSGLGTGMVYSGIRIGYEYIYYLKYRSEINSIKGCLEDNIKLE